MNEGQGRLRGAGRVAFYFGQRHIGMNMKIKYHVSCNAVIPVSLILDPTSPLHRDTCTAA